MAEGDGSAYGPGSRFYDAVYEGLVDYEGDAQFIVNAFDRFADLDASRIIDAGCGTGTHALLLAKHGWHVSGIDVSQGLLQEAREKADAAGDAGARVDFMEGDMSRVLPDGTFDGVVSLFGAFNYLLRDEDAGRFLDLAAERVPRGGLLVTEFWNPIGVRPQQGWLKVSAPGADHVYRLSRSTFDVLRDVVQIEFEFLVLDGDRVVDRFVEGHELRTRTIAAMRELLTAHGWEPLAFTEGDREGKSFRLVPFDAFRVMAIARRT